MINLFDYNPINGHIFMNDLKKEFDKTMKQTAVDFAVEQLEKLIPSGNQIIIGIIIERAKQMEKKQIIQAASTVLWNNNSNSNEVAEQYYKENYENES